MAAAILLMLYPRGVYYALPNNGKLYFYLSPTTSYFDIDNTNRFPFVIAMLSIVVLLLLVVKKENHAKKTFVLICLSFCIIASPLSWLIYRDWYRSVTLIQIIVLFLHVATLMIQVKLKNPSGLKYMSEKTDRRTWVQIDLDAIAQNVQVINKILDGKSKIMAIVKADAYGHGAAFVARELAQCGVDFFGVSSIDEAMQLRESGITQNIIILGYTNPVEENIKKLIKYNIIQTVFDFDYVKVLSETADRYNKNIKIHIKIDTGMNRLGFRYTSKNKDKNIIEKIKEIKRLDNIVCEGIFTHFAVSDEKKSDFTHEQFSLFQELINSLEKENIFFDIKHAANSGATLNFKETHLDYVRCGLILYGLYPSESVPNIGLVPAMEFKTIISQVHTVKQGETISYGRTYKADNDMLCATLPVGYADGFSRLLSNSAKVIVNGKQAPVTGVVCMDQSIIDVTDCENVKAGDIVTVFGYDEEFPAHREHISVEQVAEIMGTINYEVVCLIGKRVPRIFYRNGEEIGHLNYIK